MVYMHALRDLSPDFIALACEALSRKARGQFEPVMPSVGDIRKEVHRIDQEERLKARALEEGDPRTLVRCALCQDTGWREYKCTGREGSRSCGRDMRAGTVLMEGKNPVYFGQCSYPHPYVERCVCRGRG
jgi:hypothetical protein